MSAGVGVAARGPSGTPRTPTTGASARSARKIWSLTASAPAALAAADQFQRPGDRPVVVDADLGDDQRRSRRRRPPARRRPAGGVIATSLTAAVRVPGCTVRSRSTASAQYRSRRWSISTVSPVSVSNPRRSSPKKACGSFGVRPAAEHRRPRHRDHRAVVQKQRRQVLPAVDAAGGRAARRDVAVELATSRPGATCRPGRRCGPSRSRCHSSSPTARSMTPSPRTGTLPYSTTSASARNAARRLRPSSIACSMTSCTEASAWPAGGRAIAPKPRWSSQPPDRRAVGGDDDAGQRVGRARRGRTCTRSPAGRAAAAGAFLQPRAAGAGEDDAQYVHALNQPCQMEGCRSIDCRAERIRSFFVPRIASTRPAAFRSRPVPLAARGADGMLRPLAGRWSAADRASLRRQTSAEPVGRRVRRATCRPSTSCSQETIGRRSGGQPRRQAAARPPPRRRHVGDRQSGIRPAKSLGPAITGAAERPQPLVVPALPSRPGSARHLTNSGTSSGTPARATAARRRTAGRSPATPAASRRRP